MTVKEQTLAEALNLPASIAEILLQRGVDTPEKAEAFLNPSLEHLASPHTFDQMQIAVDRLLRAVRTEQPIAIYADRDVDGLTGLAVLVRTLRTLGGHVVWGSPMKGRGLEREVLERLIGSSAQVMVLVDCGTGEHKELEWLKSKDVDVIVADHHRFGPTLPEAFAWIHPQAERHAERGVRNAEEGILNKENLIPHAESRVPHDVALPAGCVMAFKLAQAVWISFLGTQDPERMDYFLFSHLDLIAMGLLADRMPLRGENRIMVWHGLRRLAYTRKVGLSALTRFFRLGPRSTPLTVREVNWQLIPILNAGGRLGRPDITADLLLTEDPDVARDCIDGLLGLNSQRRAAQDASLASFEKAVLDQCVVTTDPVLVAMAKGLEPSVTGLAAQALVRKYGRPTFLFVDQGAECVGSGRGLPGFDLYSWVETHCERVVKYGGHQGAVGLTIRTEDFQTFKECLLKSAQEATAALDPTKPITDHADISTKVEAQVRLRELDERWWTSLGRLAPFGTGNPMPLFEITDIGSIEPVIRRRSKLPPSDFILRSGPAELHAEFEEGKAPKEGESLGFGRWSVVGYPLPVKKSSLEFSWMITKYGRTHG
jgi:single-stranded-DNA-specific exonuclease